MQDLIQDFFSGLCEFLGDWSWARRVFFVSLLTALFALGWWHWPTAGALVASWAYLEVVARLDDVWFKPKKK